MQEQYTLRPLATPWVWRALKAAGYLWQGGVGCAEGGDCRTTGGGSSSSSSGGGLDIRHPAKAAPPVLLLLDLSYSPDNKLFSLKNHGPRR